MAGTLRTLARSFAGGEITPEMYGRIDDVRYQTGVSICRNFVTLPHGPAANRAGFEFVREVKDSTKATRLLPFAFSAVQTLIIEMGEGYFRFHSQGATVMDGAVPYEITNTYAEEDLFEIKFVQSADIVTLTHPDYPVGELRRLGATNWTFTDAAFGAGIDPPSGLNVVPTTAGASYLRTCEYVVTSVNGTVESAASASDTASNNLNAADTFNTITWTAETGATGYRVYRREGGLFYLIGVLDGNGSVSLIDDNLPYNGGITPPQASDPFADDNYPGAVTYFEQRKAFAGSTAQPQNVWTTRTASEVDFNFSVPPRDDDSIQFRIAARDYNQIIHLVPLQDLIVMTQAGEWRVYSSGDAIVPGGFGLRPQSYVGAGHATPITTGSNLIFADTAGHVREMAYADTAGGYLTGDLSLRAPHLFDGYNIVDTAQVKAPYPVLWFVSSSGDLLGLTYIPEQQVAGWHRHDTYNGSFESVAAVREGVETALYAVIQREIGGNTVRYIERQRSRAFTDQADAFFVDAGVYYSGAAIDEVTSGLEHLEGETVSILADGAVCPPQVVTSGGLPDPLPAEASTIIIGLPIEADLQTLPFAVEMQAAGQGRPKNVNEVWLRVYRSSGVFAGPNADNLTEHKQRTTEPYGSPPALVSDEINIKISPSWSTNGQVFIRQSDPLPLTVLSLAVEVVVAG
jgi:hypothetical protein